MYIAGTLGSTSSEPFGPKPICHRHIDTPKGEGIIVAFFTAPILHPYSFEREVKTDGVGSVCRLPVFCKPVVVAGLNFSACDGFIAYDVCLRISEDNSCGIIHDYFLHADDNIAAL